MRRRSLSIALACVVTALSGFSPALAQTDFYKGKTISVIVGARVTGSMSITAQIVTRHL